MDLLLLNHGPGSHAPVWRRRSAPKLIAVSRDPEHSQGSENEPSPRRRDRMAALRRWIRARSTGIFRLEIGAAQGCGSVGVGAALLDRRCRRLAVPHLEPALRLEKYALFYFVVALQLPVGNCRRSRHPSRASGALQAHFGLTKTFIGRMLQRGNRELS
jgi:hypothetical protein